MYKGVYKDNAGEDIVCTIRSFERQVTGTNVISQNIHKQYSQIIVYFF